MPAADTAYWLLRICGRAIVYSFAYLGMVMWASQVARTSARAGGLALILLFLNWLAGTVLQSEWVEEQAPALMHALAKLVPAGHSLGLWHPDLVRSVVGHARARRHRARLVRARLLALLEEGRMTDALTIRGLRKSYGRTVALDGLDLSIPKGVICGFIGPNGAGKTTTFGIVGGLIHADAGEVDILGRGPLSALRQSGSLTLLPQDCELSPHIGLRQLLVHYARLQGLGAAEAARDVDARLEEVALADRAEARIKSLSHGMRRRVSIAQALLGKPDLVLLDEPTSGLDPELVIQIRGVLAAHRGKRTLVVSSHNLLELEALCDHVVFIQRGRCTQSGSMADVTEQGLVMRYSVEATVDLAGLQTAHPELEMTWDGKSLVVRGSGSWTPANLNGAVVPYLMHMNAGLLEIRRGKSLEDAYLAGKAEAEA